MTIMDFSFLIILLMKWYYMYLYSESQHGFLLVKKRDGGGYLFLCLIPWNELLKLTWCSSRPICLTVNLGYIKDNQYILISKTGFPEKKINKKYHFQCHLIYTIWLSSYSTVMFCFYSVDWMLCFVFNRCDFECTGEQFMHLA